MIYAGIDLGGTNIAAGLVDESGRILIQDSRPTRGERGFPAIVADMANLVSELAERHGCGRSGLAGLGIGVPGTVDDQKGSAIYLNNLDMDNKPLRAEIQRHLDLPVRLGNDGDCAALAETLAGAARGAHSALMVTLGTGVGGGIVIGGKLFSGFNQAAGEFGHMVIARDGEPCTCGRRGCWEAYASASALVKQARDAVSIHPGSAMLSLAGGNPAKIDGRTIFAAARQGDPAATQVLAAYQLWLAEGIANLVNIFQPEIVVVGGGLSAQGDFLLDPVRREVANRVYGRDLMRQSAIRAASLGNDAGIIGAAMLSV